MKIGSLILGILGALFALGLAFVEDLAGGSIGIAPGNNEVVSVLEVLSIALPIVALIGAGIVMAMPMIGSALMALVAIALVFITDFNFIALIPVILLVIGALLGFLGSAQPNAAQPPGNSTVWTASLERLKNLWIWPSFGIGILAIIAIIFVTPHDKIVDIPIGDVLVADRVTPEDVEPGQLPSEYIDYIKDAERCGLIFVKRYETGFLETMRANGAVKYQISATSAGQHLIRDTGGKQTISYAVGGRSCKSEDIAQAIREKQAPIQQEQLERQQRGPSTD
jgi:hypothetical protein